MVYFANSYNSSTFLPTLRRGGEEEIAAPTLNRSSRGKPYVLTQDDLPQHFCCRLEYSIVKAKYEMVFWHEIKSCWYLLRKSYIMGTWLFKVGLVVTRAVTKALIGGGGGAYSYIRVLPDEFLLKSTLMTTDFKRNSSGRTRIYEYSPLQLTL